MIKTFGVMSTYSPDSRVVAGIEIISRQLDKLLIIDDGSQDSSILDSIAIPNVEVHKSPTNQGIANALNQGISIAVIAGASFILTLDQDTIPDEGYVQKCKKLFLESATSTRIGLALSDKINGTPSIPPRYSPESYGLVDEGIQSGMMISTECLEEIGNLDESLFIDCVDTEFCLRARRNNWNIAIVPKTNIQHALGEDLVFRPFGIRIAKSEQEPTFQAHQPFRQYYISRNNLDLALRLLSSNPKQAARIVKREIPTHLRAISGGPYRLKQFIATTVGTAHGLIRRRGKIPGWLNSYLQN